MCPAYFMQPLGEFIKIALTAFLLTYPSNHKTIVALLQCDTSAFRMVGDSVTAGPDNWQRLVYLSRPHGFFFLFFSAFPGF
jgi:hypothetical protein